MRLKHLNLIPSNSIEFSFEDIFSKLKSLVNDEKEKEKEKDIEENKEDKSLIISENSSNAEDSK